MKFVSTNQWVWNGVTQNGMPFKFSVFLSFCGSSSFIRTCAVLKVSLLAWGLVLPVWSVWVMHHITTFQSMTDCIQDGGPIRSYQYNVIILTIVLVTFGKFAVQLYLILKHLQKPKLEFIMCGDFHVHFFIDSSSAQQHSFWNLINCFT